MGKLNQIIAIEKGIKSRVVAALTETYKAVQKADLFNGFQKTYEKRDEDGEDLPAEGKRVQFHVDEVLRSAERGMSELIEVTARKDWTNCTAKGDVIVDGEILLAAVPVTHLLFLEKQVTDLRTFVSHLPVLDESEDWSKDANSGLYKSAPTKTHRTKKVSKPIVLYPATAEHPAQTQMATEDVIAGFWVGVKHSGALPKPEKQALADRVEKLLIAVKEARESANMQVEEINLPAVAAKIFGYVLPR